MSNAKKRIGKYIIFLGTKLGKGAFSEVYLGIQEETKTEVAVKVVNKNKILEDEYYKNAFYSEIQINKKLKSPNIIKFFDVHETVNNFYIVLELAQGGTLRLNLLKAGRFTEKVTMKFLFQILSGFGELVKNGITHRDLKPENILVKDDVLKIADFGFAKHSSNESYLKTLVGTPSYMAPQILNEEKYTHKCDIWSLGVMTYEMLVGKIPWHFLQKTHEGYRKEIMSREIVFPPGLEVSDNMKNFVFGCLHRDETKRFDWEQIFLHPIFNKKFQKHFQNKEGTTQINFILANLRMHLHSKNINLNKILGKLPEAIPQEEFVKLMTFIQKEMSKGEILILYKQVANNEGMVNIKDFTAFLGKYRIRMTGIDLSKYEMQCEDNSEMKSSKPGIAVFTRLKITIDQKNIDVKQFLQSLNLSKNYPLNLPTFVKVIQLIDENISEKQLQFLYRQFNTSMNDTITFEELSKNLCKIAEIVPMDEEKSV